MGPHLSVSAKRKFSIRVGSPCVSSPFAFSFLGNTYIQRLHFQVESSTGQEASGICSLWPCDLQSDPPVKLIWVCLGLERRLLLFLSWMLWSSQCPFPNLSQKPAEWKQVPTHFWFCTSSCFWKLFTTFVCIWRLTYCFSFCFQSVYSLKGAWAPQTRNCRDLSFCILLPCLIDLVLPCSNPLPNCPVRSLFLSLVLYWISAFGITRQLESLTVWHNFWLWQFRLSAWRCQRSQCLEVLRWSLKS